MNANLLTVPEESGLKVEPVAVTAAVQTLLGAIIGLFGAFNVWSPTEDQYSAIFLTYAAVTAVVLMFVRGAVTPNTNVDVKVQNAEIRGIAFGAAVSPDVVVIPPAAKIPAKPRDAGQIFNNTAFWIGVLVAAVVIILVIIL